MSRPTHQQLETLMDFLVQNPGIAKGLLRTAHAKQETKRKWNDIAVSLNAIGGAQKDGKGWAKYWADKKCALKKICAQHAQSLRLTGGGSADDVPTLAPIDQRLVAVMGGIQFAVGDSHVAVNPFPSTSQSQHDMIPSEEQIIVPDLESPASPVQNVETVRAISTPRQRSARRSRSLLDQDQERFTEIERKRVEAEYMTARAFTKLAEQIAELGGHMQSIPTAVRDSNQSMANAISVGLAAVADALRENRQ